jgi:HAD superfamily hydrolase (TIGR01509 family)
LARERFASRLYDTERRSDAALIAIFLDKLSAKAATIGRQSGISSLKLSIRRHDAHIITASRERIMAQDQAAFLFDLDGTLVDSVYQHVLAWKDALDEEGIELSVWRIHRKIGMSGGLFTNMLLRETGVDISEDRVRRLRERHAAAFLRRATSIRPLPGAQALLANLTDAGIPWAIATSGRMETAQANLKALGVDPNRVPVVTRDQVKYAKPDPHLFLAAAERLGADICSALVVGDSIWDMLAARRARAFGVGLLSGGYGQEELERAGAMRVYEDPADLLKHLDEVGTRP